MRNFLTSLALVVLSGSLYAQDVVFHHELTVAVDPATAKLEVKDTISFPESTDLSGLTFSLHENLSPKSLTDGVSIEQFVDEAGAKDKGMDQEDYTSVIKINHYRVLVADGIKPESLTL